MAGVVSDLKTLSKTIEVAADDYLDKWQDDPEEFGILVNAVALASAKVDELAREVGENTGKVTARQLEEIAALAQSFDDSGEPFLQKQASVLDELLLTIAAPKNSIAQAKKADEDEINRLRNKYRKTRGDECYQFPKESLDKQNQVKEQAAAVDKVKRFAPLEASLSTRYAPDYPGNMMTRINDHVYQDPMTGKIYDFKAGYRTNKGNEVPGTAVENQIPDLGTTQEGHTMFSTRESILSSHAQAAEPSGLEEVKRALASGLESMRRDNTMHSTRETLLRRFASTEDSPKQALAQPVVMDDLPFELDESQGDSAPPDGFADMYSLIERVAEGAPELAQATLQVVKQRAQELGWGSEWIGMLNRAGAVPLDVALEDVSSVIDDPTIDYTWETEQTGDEPIQTAVPSEGDIMEIAARLRAQGMETEAAKLELFAGAKPGEMELLESVGSLKAVLKAF